jgi:hypothetical protein
LEAVTIDFGRRPCGAPPTIPDALRGGGQCPPCCARLVATSKDEEGALWSRVEFAQPSCQFVVNSSGGNVTVPLTGQSP